MASEQVNVRMPDEELKMLDILASALVRERAGNTTPKVSRADAVRSAIREAYERRAEQVSADQAAWAALVGIGGETAMLTLRGEGQGEPLPEERTPMTMPDGRRAIHVLPARWDELEVTATVDGQPVDLPLIVEKAEMSDLTVNVFLTDPKGKARVYLGPLEREVKPRPAYYDNRLFNIADELGLRG